MKQWIVIVLMLMGGAVNSQTVLIEEEPLSDTIPQTFGKNLANYFHWYGGYEMVCSDFEGDGAKVNMPASGNWTIGFRYKRKVTGWFAVGTGLFVSSTIWKIKQNDTKSFPNLITHDKEKVSVGQLGGDVYLRFNYGRRGNKIGNYIDVGGYGFLVTFSEHKTTDKPLVLDEYNSSLIIKQHRRLAYIEKFGYGIKARIGFDRYVISATYRVSDLTKAKYDLFPDFPRLSVGLEIGFF
jgi:hypothetical protein